MAYTSWRGVIGLIKPTKRPGSTEEMIRMLPEGIGVIPLFLDVRRGSHKEFEDAIHVYESYIEQLMEQEVDLVCPEGGGPFILIGHKGEVALTNKWRKRFGVPMVTSSLSQVNSMRALGMKRPCIASYATGVKDEERDAYYRAAGFNVAGQAVVPLDDFEKAGQLSVQEVYAGIKKRFLEMPKADGILIRGSGWRSLEAIELLEQDLGVPVSHAVTARVWEVQKRLHVHQPVKGFGRLMSKLPGNVPD